MRVVMKTILITRFLLEVCALGCAFLAPGAVSTLRSQGASTSQGTGPIRDTDDGIKHARAQTEVPVFPARVANPEG